MTRLGGGGSDFCTVVVGFKPVTVLNTTTTNIRVSYDAGRGGRQSLAFPISANSLCRASLSVGSYSLVNGNGGKAIAVQMIYNGDLLNQIRNTANDDVASCTFPPVTLSNLALNNSTTKPQGGDSSTNISNVFNVLGLGNSNVLNPSQYKICGSSVSSSCYLEVGFNPQFNANNNPNGDIVANADFAAILSFTYQNQQNTTNIATPISTSATYTNVLDQTYTLTQDSVSSVWNPGTSSNSVGAFGASNDGAAFRVYLRGSGSSNVAATLYSISLPTDAYFYQTSADRTASGSCVVNSVVPPSGCTLSFHFKPTANSAVSPAQTNWPRSGNLPLSIKYGFPAWGITSNNPKQTSLNLVGTITTPPELIVYLVGDNQAFDPKPTNYGTSSFSYPGVQPSIIPAPTPTFLVSSTNWQEFRIINIGGSQATNVSLSVPNPISTGFGFNTPQCPTINPGSTCTGYFHFGEGNPPSGTYSLDTTLAYTTGSTYFWPSSQRIRFSGTYGYVAPIIPTILSNPSAQATLNFGNTIYGGAPIVQKVTLTVGNDPLTLSSVNGGQFSILPDPGATNPATSTASGSSCFSPQGGSYTFPARAVCTFQIVFTPPSSGSGRTSYTGAPRVNYTDTVDASKSGSLTYNSTGSTEGAPTVSLTPVAGSLNPNPTLYGRTSDVTFTLQNSSPNFSVDIGAPILAGSPGVNLVNNSCGGSLGGNGACSFTVRFSPPSAVTGGVSGTVTAKYYSMTSDNRGIAVRSAQGGSGDLSSSFSGGSSSAIQFAIIPSNLILDFGSTSPGVPLQARLSFSSITGSKSGWFPSQNEGGGSTTLQGKNLPQGVSIVTNDCGTNSGGNSSCSVLFQFSSNSATSLNQALSLNYFNDTNATQATGTLGLTFKAVVNVAHGDLQINTTTLDFGKKAFRNPQYSSQPTSGQSVIVLTNRAPAPPTGAKLTLGSIDGISDPFTILSQLPGSLPSGVSSSTPLCRPGLDLSPGGSSSCAIPIQFSPQAAKAFSQTLQIRWVDAGDSANTRTQAVSLLGVGTQPLAIAAGGGSTCILSEIGQVKCWGNNSQGQLGNPSLNVGARYQEASINQPISFPIGSNILQVGVGYEFACALLGSSSSTSGSVYCWGSNSKGQLGYSTRAANVPAPSSPVALTGNATKISLGYAHACALMDDRSVQCWGANGSGQLGNGNLTDSLSNGNFTPPSKVGSFSDLSLVSAGTAHTCLSSGNGVTRCFGANTYGQLGQGNVTTSTYNVTSLPPMILSSSAITQTISGNPKTCAVANGSVGGSVLIGTSQGSAMSCMVPSDNPAVVRCFGQTYYDYNLGGLQHFTALLGFPLCRFSLSDTGYSCFDSRADSTKSYPGSSGASSFGVNCGDMGAGLDGSSGSIPVSFPYASSGGVISQLALGDTHTCVLAKDNSNAYVGCWGLNVNGQLGNHSTSNSTGNPSDFSSQSFWAISSPLSGTAVPLQIASGSAHTCVVYSNNTVSCWGQGSSDFANGFSGDLTTPTQVYSGN